VEPMDQMGDAERLLVQRQIASLIDSPSVYMGGPSPRAMKIAGRIIDELESSFRLRGTRCGHGSWENYHQHGTYCPTCGMDLHKTEQS
jgi:hypothetical protein